MIAATTSKRLHGATKLMVLNKPNRVEHTHVHKLANFFAAGDVLVVNRSGTLPASFTGLIERSGQEVEIRLAAFQGPDPDHLNHWLAFSFGSGDWRVPTEDRGDPPELQAGDRIAIGTRLCAEVRQVHHQRLLHIRFSGPNILRELYRHGTPIQYAYHQEALAIWDQQTLFAGPPVSVEPPSAGFPFTWDLMGALEDRGVSIAPLLHSAGLSSTGSAEFDALLPLAEWYQVPETSMNLVKAARKLGKRVVALGTTALRALETAWSSGKLRGVSRLKITSDYRMQVVTSLVSGMHEPESSHAMILRALCPEPLLAKGYRDAEEQHYRGHEYGDLSLLDCQVCHQ